MDSAIIVLCCHRSGSSMIAHMLHRLGVDMGEGHFMPPSKNNSSGYYEDMRFTDLNERVLRSVGGSWNVNVRPEELTRDVQWRFGSEIFRLIGSRLQYGIWGFKDPRTALTIPLWQCFLVHPRYIVVLRDPKAISRSLQKRNGFSEEDGLRLASMYYYRIWQFLNKCEHPVLQVKYEDVLRDPITAAKRLRDFTGAKGSLPIDVPNSALNHYIA